MLYRLIGLLIAVVLALPGVGLCQDKTKKAGYFHYGTAQRHANTVLGSYLLRDKFVTAIVAGSINGTATEPGPGTRTVVDTNTVLSITGGYLQKSGVGVSTVDPRDAAPVITRAPGLMLISSSWLNHAAEAVYIGPGAAATGGSGKATFVQLGTTMYIIEPTSGANLAVATVSLNTEYQLISILRATGAQFLVKAGANYNLLYVSPNDSTATLYPVIRNGSTNNSIWKVGKFIIPSFHYLISPLLSTSGAMTWPTTNGLGHAEGVAGGIGTGGARLIFTDSIGTWATNGTVINASALVGGIAIATADCGTANIHATCILARSAGNVGNVWRYIDTDNYLFSYHDGTNCVLKQRLAGVETTLITAAVALGAGAIGINFSGTSARLYLNETLVGSTAVIDTSFSVATKHGFYTTNTGNTMNNFVVYARGDEKQYDILNRFSQ